MSSSIDIKSASGTYQAHVGRGILDEYLKKEIASLNPNNLFVLIDENVRKHHSQHLEPLFDKLSERVHLLSVPEGESSKSLAFWSEILDFLLQNHLQRSDAVVVIGGGVTGDVGAFAAASALRGVPLIHIPTTLLAMVDSSIGGKTGINHEMGKNLIGAFYQPKSVIADTRFLDTLPEMEWSNGLSEVLKYGAIRDRVIFDECERFLDGNRNKIPAKTLISLITRCIRVKADVVAEDEFEGGIRAFLNYGHTFAHALERACDYGKISHGEAVWLGMIAAQHLSKLRGYEAEGDFIRKFRPLYHFRVSAEELSSDELNRHMKSDKKRDGDHIRFILLKKWQHPVIETVMDEDQVNEAWQMVFRQISPSTKQ
ncbi:MAG: 3-dehydroquinate synthase [Balneolaceae bacterium]|nr:3-dehydroquinate synthase [Balneolaceae bacterium]MCH8547519.1 3-dehydroquinate synthase [Balneolaceae bacterium]